MGVLFFDCCRPPWILSTGGASGILGREYFLGSTVPQRSGDGPGVKVEGRHWERSRGPGVLTVSAGHGGGAGQGTLLLQTGAVR